MEPPEVAVKVRRAVEAALEARQAELERERARAAAAEKAAAELAERLAVVEREAGAAVPVPAAEAAREVEAALYSRVASLSNRCEALERRLKNARFVAEASEELASSALVKQLEAEREAAAQARAVRRLALYVDCLRRRDQRRRLAAARRDRETAMAALETELRNLAADPEIGLPVGVGKRRQLERGRDRQARLAEDDRRAAALLAELDATEAADDALRVAAARGALDAVKRSLARGARAEAPDESGANALDYACGNGHANVARACLDAGADPAGDSLGYGAALSLGGGGGSGGGGDFDAATVASAATATSTATSSTTTTTKKAAAALAAHAASRPLILAASRGHLDVARVLVDFAGPGRPAARLLEAADAQGATALHAAAANAHLGIARFLLHAGAPLHARDALNSTPLHYAAGARRGDTEDVVDIINLFIANGASLSAANTLEETPIDTARRVGRYPVICALNEHRRKSSNNNSSNKFVAPPPPLGGPGASSSRGPPQDAGSAAAATQQQPRDRAAQRRAPPEATPPPREPATQPRKARGGARSDQRDAARREPRPSAAPEAAPDAPARKARHRAAAKADAKAAASSSSSRREGGRPADSPGAAPLRQSASQPALPARAAA